MQTDLSPELISAYFPQFSEPELQAEILENAELHSFMPGQMIVDYGSYVRMIPLIISGNIKVSRIGSDGSELFLYYLNRGESCTMTFSCCMASKRSEIKAVAEEATTILGLPPKVLDEWIMKYKSWKNFVLTAYDSRMLELIETLDHVAFHQLDERLMDYLEKRKAAAGTHIVTATHQEIAYDLNVSREAVSRLLKTLEKQGKIALGRNQIHFRME